MNILIPVCWPQAKLHLHELVKGGLVLNCTASYKSPIFASGALIVLKGSVLCIYFEVIESNHQESGNKVS